MLTIDNTQTGTDYVLTSDDAGEEEPPGKSEPPGKKKGCKKGGRSAEYVLVPWAI